jgi:lipoprotein-anchoring transpeptidase ErfK/SrfK
MDRRIITLTVLMMVAIGAGAFGLEGLLRPALVTADSAAEPAPIIPPARDAPPVGAAPTTTAPAPTAPPSTAPATMLPAGEQHPLPAGSGAGRRVVFSVGDQRMWWVDDEGVTVRTAAVSGRERTPTTGTFQVYSRSERATGLDGSSMNHFVRFTKGPNGWAIGFHDIPVKDGRPVQTLDQLGTALSHGCIRQASEDARFTWEFLQIGDTVVVVD